MAVIDQEYHKLLNTILKEGFTYEDLNRKGVKRIQIPSYQIKHDFKDGFPALSTKEVYFKGAVGELLVFLSGSTELKDLHRNKVRFWDKDAFNFYQKRNPKATIEDFKLGVNKHNHIAGDLGKIYPYQLRNWNGEVDQFTNLIDTLRNSPMATKKTVTMWNPSLVNGKDMCLSQCHWSFEILVEPTKDTQNGQSFSGGILDFSETPSFTKTWEKPKYQFTLKWHQHSVDTFLGLPINIMYYSLMAEIIGKMTNMIPKGIIGDLSNVHIYEPHLDAVKEQLSRDIYKYGSCQLTMLDEFHYMTDEDLIGNLHVGETIDKFRIDMFKLKDYNSYPMIKAEMLAYN